MKEEMEDSKEERGGEVVKMKSNKLPRNVSHMTIGPRS